MDHADIRGLVTAFHGSVAGLPRSSIGDHRIRCPHSPAEDSPHRVRASRSRCSVLLLFSSSWLSSCRMDYMSGLRDNVLTDVPDKAE